jgi:hypothetical protein
MGDFLALHRFEKWAQRFITEDGNMDFDFMEGTWGKSPELWIAARRYNLHFVLYKPEELPKFTVYFPHEVI